MSYKVIYHGSESIVEKPVFHYEGSNEHNDYGLGFYCTKNLDMAKEWANKRTTNGFANKYEIDERRLKILNLCDKSKYSVLDWIAILVHNREFDEDVKIEFRDVFEYLEKFYIDVTKYDLVIGYRADDAYFRFPLMFIKNILTYEKLEEIYLLGNLGQQYVLISEKAFNKIKFVKAIGAEPIYRERYLKRKDAADNSYKALELEQRIAKGTRVRDMIKNND